MNKSQNSHNFKRQKKKDKSTKHKSRPTNAKTKYFSDSIEAL
jgi:hypothetical protein